MPSLAKSRPPGSTAVAPPGPGAVVVQEGRQTWLFQDPVDVRVAYSVADVLPELIALEQAVTEQGLYAAGFLTYEAAAAFNLETHPRTTDDPPLLWFGLYEKRLSLDTTAVPSGTYEVGTWQAALDAVAYTNCITRIKGHIARGDTYQVNFTMPLQAQFSGDSWALYQDLVAAQQAGHTAFVDTGRFAICSASPELFFERAGSHILSRPMKGTARRGRTLSEDETNMVALRTSEKNRAENVMIVDMIRNDLGRIARTGSVRVPQLFTIERYPTLLQMTSTVSASTDATAVEVMQAMFPCASITGAPKVRTMEIIKELEPGPRGVYTGSIGYFGPGNHANFNVAIRTVVLDRERQTASYHVGSGIVWDSEPAQEYAECLLKAAVLLRRRDPFSLLETMRWSPQEGYFLLGHHMDRLRDSAAYFGFVLDEAALHEALDLNATMLDAPSKVRLLLNQAGEVSLQSSPLPASPDLQPRRLLLAQSPIATDNIWLYHKTTRRDVYEQARAAQPGGDDVLLWNEAGFLTEATTANIVVQLDGRLLTPPVSAGLLAGTFRRHLLQRGEIAEQPLRCSDLNRSEALFLINSVRGWQPAILVEQIK